MSDRVASPAPYPDDKLKPLFTHKPLSRRGTPREDTQQPHLESLESLESLEPALHLSPSHGSRPNTVSASASASALVQPGVEGSTTQNRPSNSWLRYRRLKQVELAHLGLKMGELSKVIAKMWREEPQEIKDFHKAQCQEQWASDRANGYQYRQPKMPLPGEPRAKKGRSGPWRKTQRPLLEAAAGAGSAPPELGGQLNPLWAPLQVAHDDDEEAVGPETNSAMQHATLSCVSGNPHGRGSRGSHGSHGSRGSRGSPNARPSPSRPRLVLSDPGPGAIPEVALHRNHGLHPSTPPNNLSSSTSSLFRPEDCLSPALLATTTTEEHKHEQAEFEFSPPRSEYDMDVDAGVPLAPMVTTAQSPLSDTPSSPGPAQPQGITLPSLRQDPILGRALELPPVHDYFTHSPPRHTGSGTSPPSNRSSLASSILPRLRTALFTSSASPPHTPWDDERPILHRLITQPTALPPHLKSHALAGPSSAHPDTRPPVLPTSSRHQRVMSYPGAFETSFSSGSVLRTSPRIAAVALTARPYPTRGQSPPTPRRRHASPLSDLRPIPPLRAASPVHSRPQSQPESEDEPHALVLRLPSEGAPRPGMQSVLSAVLPVPSLSRIPSPMQNQDSSVQGLRRSWDSQIHSPLHPPSTPSSQADHARTANGAEKVKRSRKVAQGAGDKEMRFLHTFSRDVWNSVDDGSAGVSLPLPVVDWPNAPEPTGGTSSFVRGHDVTSASPSLVNATRPSGGPGGTQRHTFDQAFQDPSYCSHHINKAAIHNKGAHGRGEEYGQVDEDSDVGEDILAGCSVSRDPLPISGDHRVHKMESPPHSTRVIDSHISDEVKSAPQPLHPTKAEEGMRPEMPIHGSRKYGRMQDHTFRVAPLRPIELPSYCDPPTGASQAPSGSEAHNMGSSDHEHALSSAPTISPELLTDRSTGTSPTGEQMFWMFDTSGKTFVGYDGRIPHRTRGQRGRPRGRPRGSGRGTRVTDTPNVDGADSDVAMRMPTEYIMTGMTSTPDLNEGEKGLEERSNIDEQNV